MAASGDRSPAARALRAFEERSREQQVRDAVVWLQADPRRKGADATALFPLVGTTDALRKQVAKRNRNGILFQRPEMEVLTDAEKDTLIQDYLDAGYSGLPKPAQLLIQGGVRSGSTRPGRAVGQPGHDQPNGNHLPFLVRLWFGAAERDLHRQGAQA